MTFGQEARLKLFFASRFRLLCVQKGMGCSIVASVTQTRSNVICEQVYLLSWVAWKNMAGYNLRVVCAYLVRYNSSWNRNGLVLQYKQNGLLSYPESMERAPFTGFFRHIRDHGWKKTYTYVELLIYNRHPNPFKHFKYNKEFVSKSLKREH